MGKGSRFTPPFLGSLILRSPTFAVGRGTKEHTGTFPGKPLGAPQVLASGRFAGSEIVRPTGHSSALRAARQGGGAPGRGFSPFGAGWREQWQREHAALLCIERQSFRNLRRRRCRAGVGSRSAPRRAGRRSFREFPRPEALRGHHAESDGGPARSDVWQDAKLYRMIIPGHAQRKQPGARQENSVRPRSSDLRDSGASAGRCRSRTSGSARESGVWA